MVTVYLDKWDNYPMDVPERLEALDEVLELVDKSWGVKVSFDYAGFTRELQAGEAMLQMARERGYDGSVGYRESLRLYKKYDA